MDSGARRFVKKNKDIFFSVVRGGKYNFRFQILENMSTLLHAILQINVQWWVLSQWKKNMQQKIHIQKYVL